MLRFTGHTRMNRLFVLIAAFGIIGPLTALCLIWTRSTINTVTQKHHDLDVLFLPPSELGDTLSDDSLTSNMQDKPSSSEHRSETSAPGEPSPQMPEAPVPIPPSPPARVRVAYRPTLHIVCPTIPRDGPQSTHPVLEMVDSVVDTLRDYFMDRSVDLVCGVVYVRGFVSNIIYAVALQPPAGPSLRIRHGGPEVQRLDVGGTAALHRA